MKLCFMMLHYGLPYLEAALKAIKPQVDHIILFYAAKPSQGFVTDMACPDDPGELKAIADKYGAEWIEGNWATEGDHCGAVWAHADNYDWIVRIDSDEIVPLGAVDYWISVAEKSNAKMYKAPFQHFWRSFSKVCKDGQMPDRLYRVKGGDGFAYLDDGFLIGEPEKYRVFHMGYAQPTKYIEYKMQVQAHRPEWRPDWFRNKWIPNAQTDIHPVCLNFWNAGEFDLNRLPEILREHPYYGKKVIE